PDRLASGREASRDHRGAPRSPGGGGGRRRKRSFPARRLRPATGHGIARGGRLARLRRSPDDTARRGARRRLGWWQGGSAHLLQQRVGWRAGPTSRGKARLPGARWTRWQRGGRGVVAAAGQWRRSVSPAGGFSWRAAEPRPVQLCQPCVLVRAVVERLGNPGAERGGLGQLRRGVRETDMW